MKKTITTLLLLLFFLPVFAISNNEYDQQLLVEKLNKLPQSDTSRLKVLYDIIQITYPKPSEQAKYIDILIKDATFHQNNRYICHAYLATIITAYNNYDYENAVKWKNILEPLAMKEKLYDIAFKAKRAVIELLVINEEFEKQESESLKMLQEAIALNNKQGIILAKQTLSIVYTETFRYKEATEVLKEALALEPIYPTKFEIYYSLIEIYKHLDDTPNMLKYTLEHDKLIHEYMKIDPAKLDLLMQNYIFLTDYYVYTKNKKLASKYIDSIHLYYSDDYSDMVKTDYNENCCSYYYFTKQYSKAIEHIDEAIKLTANTFFKNYYTKYLLYKADILRKSGRQKESMEWYKVGVMKMDSIRLVKITKQEEYLRIKFDAHNYLLKNQTITNYHNRVVIIAILLILIILIYFICHTIKVRRQLKKDEEEMRVMTNEMEAANTAKDNFLNNISNSISVPLNYIVENSQRLGSEEVFSSDQKRDLSATLRINSSKLMDMINDILDFSRLEAGMMKLTKEKTNIISLINRTIAEDEQYKGIGISSQFTQGKDDYMAVVDTLRFQTLIRSTLQSISDNTSALYILIKDNNKTNELCFIVKNSWLSMDNPSQVIIIRNEINRSMMQQFDGAYNIDTKTNTVSVVIKYTLCCESDSKFH